MPDVSGAEVHLALIHHVRAKPKRLSAEITRVDVACRRAQLRVLHVMIEKFQTVDRSKLQLGRERTAWVGFAGVETPAKIADGKTESEWRSDFGQPLRAQVYSAGALDFGADAAAFAGAIHPQLNDLVIQSGCQLPRHAQRIGAGEDDVARQDDADDVSENIGDLLLPDVEDVERERRRPEAMQRQHEAECVTDSGHRFGVVDRQLFLLLVGDRGW